MTQYHALFESVDLFGGTGSVCPKLKEEDPLVFHGLIRESYNARMMNVYPKFVAFIRRGAFQQVPASDWIEKCGGGNKRAQSSAEDNGGPRKRHNAS